MVNEFLIVPQNFTFNRYGIASLNIEEKDKYPKTAAHLRM